MSKQKKEEKEIKYDKTMLSIVALWEGEFTIIWRLFHMAVKFNKLRIISLMLWKTLHPDLKSLLVSWFYTEILHELEF